MHDLYFYNVALLLLKYLSSSTTVQSTKKVGLTWHESIWVKHQKEKKPQCNKVGVLQRNNFQQQWVCPYPWSNFLFSFCEPNCERDAWGNSHKQLKINHCLKQTACLLVWQLRSLSSACAPLPHLRILLCALVYFLFGPFVPLVVCCVPEKHCSCHFVCLHCVSVYHPAVFLRKSHRPILSGSVTTCGKWQCEQCVLVI